ncbi:MAG: MaoC family dehydratase N-terminal domain-containing protein [Pseudomonadota bacterium]
MAKTVNPNDWIGKQQYRSAVIDDRSSEMIAVTMGQPIPQAGEPLPTCWHWAWFNDALPASELGRDGHPKKGGFMPPIPLPRRMWAGGDIEFHEPIVIGKEHQKLSTIKNIVEKDGRSGRLFIVTIEHVVSCGKMVCVRENQNLVYRDDPVPGVPKPSPPEPPGNPDDTKELCPDSVMMFRYSALTFNGHRIHYDVDYAREVEGYPGLVFHAPLTATMLCRFAQDARPELPVRKFSYRATSPLYCGDKISLCAKDNGQSGTIVWATTPGGHQAMIGEVSF